MPYEGHFQGGTAIVDSDGTVLARRDRREGQGVVVAEVTPGRSEPLDRAPDRFWLHRRGALSAWAWNTERQHGRRWYRRHLPPAA